MEKSDVAHTMGMHSTGNVGKGLLCVGLGVRHRYIAAVNIGTAVRRNTCERTHMQKSDPDSVAVRRSGTHDAIGQSRTGTSRGGDDTSLVVLGEINEQLEILGRECRDHFDRTRSQFLEMAVRIAAAKDLLTKNGGRGSEYPKWLARHLPEIDQKTADRWAAVARAFKLKLDTLSTFVPLAKNFKVTALYQLAGPSVPEAARQEAIEQAKANKPITPGIAAEYVQKHTKIQYLRVENVGSHSGFPKHPTKRLFRKAIQLQAGTIRIAILHEDFRQALTEALGALNQAESETPSPL